jgi:Co/Zn/Cd efflux system component
LVGAAVITRWAYGLIQDTSAILLDNAADPKVQATIMATIESDADNRIADLHVWSIGSDRLAAIVSLVTHYPKAPDYYRGLLASIPNLVHVVVEVYQCHGHPCIEPQVEPQSLEAPISSRH